MKLWEGTMRKSHRNRSSSSSSSCTLTIGGGGGGDDDDDNSVPDDVDEADLDAELAMLEDDLEGIGEEEADANVTPSYLQPGE